MGYGVPSHQVFSLLFDHFGESWGRTSEGSATVIDAGAEGQQLVHAVHSPQNWLADFGSSRLVAGEAVVAEDSAFAKVASLDAPYHVFLTPLGDCALYVAEKAATSFSVRSLGDERCNIAFDCRIVGLRRGYETVRMEQFVETSDE